MSKASPIGRVARAVAADLERDVDVIEDILAAGEKRERKVRLLVYAGYRNAAEMRLSGRVVRFEDPLDAGDNMLSRLRAMGDIYNSDELAGVVVRCEGHGRTADTVTDEEGYFHFSMAVAAPLPQTTQWEKVRLSTPRSEAQQPAFDAPILAPGVDDHWAIISDIDDTVIETGATDFLKNWRRVLLDRPTERLAVPGASTLYKLFALDHEAPVRPFFYVSSSPWNLYGFIAEFMAHNHIPHGPMFLKDYGIDASKFIDAGHHAHKRAAIETILAFYPGFRFLLIGDNGQQDVEIYAQAVRDFPGRVAAVFIRDVNGSCREGAASGLLAGIEAAGIPIFCGAGFDDAVAIAKSLDLERPVEIAKAVAQKPE